VEVVAPVVPVAPEVPAPAVPELWAFIASIPAVANGVFSLEVGLLPCCVQ
jgi:hypothetical protein